MKKSIFNLLAVLAALVIIAFAFGCGKSGSPAGDSLREVAALPVGETEGTQDLHESIHHGHDHGPMLDPSDPYADEVREYLRTGIPPVIPKWGKHFELPYIGPVITRDGIVFPDGMPLPDLYDWEGEVESLADMNREPSKVNLPNPKPNSTGSCRALYVIVQWNDWNNSKTAAAVYEKLFADNTGRTCPSLRNFYLEMSYNKLDINGDVIGPLTINTPRSGSQFWSDVITRSMSAADEIIDFNQFDSNNDGYIDSVTFILPHNDNQLRAFVSYIGNWPTRYDNKRLFAWGALAMDDVNPESATAHHEMGHFLMLPDYYDLGGDSAPPSPGNDGNESFGLGLWDLMSAGNWTNPPMHTSAYNKWLLNWLEPSVLTSDVTDLILYPSNWADRPNEVYLLWTEGVYNQEFFLIENRWYPTSPALGQGLLIWHIDENVFLQNYGGASQYGVNDFEDHKALDLEEADGQRHLDRMINYGDSGDVWPFGSKNFDYDSNPNSRSYDGEDTLVRIFNIRKDTANKAILIDASVTGFTFNLSPLPPLVTGGTTEIQPNVNDKVEHVQIFLNDNLVLDSSNPPFVYTWNTTDTLLGQYSVKGIGTGVEDERTIIHDLLVDNTPALYPLADNAESGFFQFFPLNARYPSNSLRIATRKVAGTPEDIAGETFGEWRQRVDWKTSGERSFYCGMGSGSYANFQNDYLVSRRINLSGVSTPTLSFSHQYDLELDKDFARVLVTDDDGRTFTEIASYTGTQTNTRETIEFPAFASKTVRVVFFFESDGSGTDNGSAIPGSGWWIDDIAVWSAPISDLPSIKVITPSGTDPLSGLVNVTVSTFGSITRVEYFVYHSGGTFTSQSSNEPVYPIGLPTLAWGNQRVTLEARAVSPSGFTISDIKTLDIYNLVGDTNNDGVVDEADLELILTHYGKTSTHADYRIWLDCNGDGVIDEQDAAIVGYSFGMTK